MMLLETLKIQNFRGFDKLEIDGFSKINVLVGENNCGKTSVLESIFLLSGMSNPRLALRIHSMRGISGDKSVFKYLFYNLDFKNKPVINGNFSGNTSRKVEISPVFEKNVIDREIESTAIENSLSVAPIPDIVGLDYIFSLRKNRKATQSFESGLRFEENGIRPLIDPNYKEDILSAFLTSENINSRSRLLPELLVEPLKALFVAKKEHIVNDLLSKFDTKIKGLNVVGNEIYIDKEGIAERIPLKLMGAGIRWFLYIVATIAANNEKNFICLIDEIENGLHWKSQVLIWQAIIELTRNTNTQLFITTHSLEMLQSLIHVMKKEENVDMQDSMKVISIENTLNAGFQAYGRSFDGLDLLLYNSMEIR